MTNQSPQSPPNPSALKLPPWLIVLAIVGMMGYSWWQKQHTTPPTTVATDSDSPLLLRPIANDSTHSLPDGFDADSVVPAEDEPTLADVAPEQNHEGVVATQQQPLSLGRPENGVDSTNKNRSTDSPRGPPARRTNSPQERDSSASNPTPPTPRPPQSGPLSEIRSKSVDGPTVKANKPARQDGQKGVAAADDDSLQVPNQTIRDLNGRVVFKGTIDLKPTLDRIERGEANRHRNDGATFQNRENRLPRKPAGYYKEYVHPTPGEYGPGPQRIIIGKEGDIWYTADHYKTFKKIKQN